MHRSFSKSSDSNHEFLSLHWEIIRLYRKHFRADLKYDFFYYLLWVSKFLTTLIFPKNQRQCASFLINVAILFLSIRSSGAPPCPTNWSTVSATQGWEGYHWLISALSGGRERKRLIFYIYILIRRCVTYSVSSFDSEKQTKWFYSIVRFLGKI